MTVRAAKWMLIVTLIGAYFVSGAANAGTPPPCYPKAPWFGRYKLQVLAPGISTRFDAAAAWVCEFPNGYQSSAVLINQAQMAIFVLTFVTGQITEQQAANDCKTTCTDDLTDAEVAARRAMAVASQPSATVMFNGSQITRSVYAANADGTLNPTPVAHSSIAVGAPCDSALRLIATPDYYSVQGQPDASNPGQTLGSLYAKCIVALPIGASALTPAS